MEHAAHSGCVVVELCLVPDVFQSDNSFFVAFRWRGLLREENHGGKDNQKQHAFHGHGFLSRKNPRMTVPQPKV
jgi:hypothetical protein